MKQYDFSGWATRTNLKCSDGRTIMKDAFKHNDGQTVPLVWNHQHDSPFNVLGHALLENREEGVYAYCKFNDSESGAAAKCAVVNGDVKALSIHANQLKQDRGNVLHGCIREVSLVLAGANPGARIDYILSHSADTEDMAEEALIFFEDGDIEMKHAEPETKEPEVQPTEEQKEPEVQPTEQETEESEVKPTEEAINHAEPETKESEIKETDKTNNEQKTDDKKEKTIQEVYDEFTEEQKNVVHAMIGLAIEQSDESKNNENKNQGENEMKRNVFDKENKTNTLSHSAQKSILDMAKQSNVGSLKLAMELYTDEQLQHGIQEGAEGLDLVFPEFKNITPGAPELIRQDQSWVMSVINKIHKSPYSKIRMRQADARIADLKAKGYQKKGDKKEVMEQIKLLSRTFDPQTIYIKDELNRDDIIDIQDFDYVKYQWSIMNDSMYETLALAALIGDGRDDGDPDKISETHIHSILNDDELYTIHKEVDVEEARTRLQGTNTNANFGENFIYAEAMIEAALYSREQFKGSGRPDLYCTPHLVNVMLLARDLNGRRIYDSKADLAKALNVGEIHEIEQFEGKTRTTDDGDKKLLGIFVNLADYQFGSVKGGEITRFDDFDIDFNKYKYLMETRLSGALTRIKSAIVLEEPVKAGE